MKSLRRACRLLSPPRHERLSSDTTSWRTRSATTYLSTSDWSEILPRFRRLAREIQDTQHENLDGAVNRPEDRPAGIPCMMTNYRLLCLQTEHPTGTGIGCQTSECFRHGVWIGIYNHPGRIIDKL